MLAALARNWGWLFFRGVLAAAFGITVFAWPSMAMVGFVYLFGLYAIFDGMVALAIAIDVKELQGFGSLLFEALVRIGGGLVAMGEPAIIISFPRFFAVWAIVAGLGEAVVALVLRRELAGEWPLPFAGALSVVIALLLLTTTIAVGVPELRWLVGPYGILFGVTLLGFARRLHQVSQEIEAA